MNRFLKPPPFWNHLEMPKLYEMIIPVGLGNTLKFFCRSKYKQLSAGVINISMSSSPIQPSLINIPCSTYQPNLLPPLTLSPSNGPYPTLPSLPTTPPVPCAESLLVFFFTALIPISPYSGVICGAITSQYLLEKSRIVFQVCTLPLM